MRKDVRTALRIVWMTISLAVLFMLAAPFLLGGQRISRLLPPCEWKVRYHRECSFCGMTTGFLAISDGRLEEARRANAGSIPLYSAFLLNELLAACSLRQRKGGTKCK